MKKINFKNYIFISLVLITSFFAFSNDVKAEPEYIKLYSYTDYKEFNSHDFATFMSNVNCTFDGDKDIVNVEKNLINYSFNAVSGKSGHTIAKCQAGANGTGMEFDITVYDKPVEKTVPVLSGKEYVKEDFISQNLNLHLGENNASNGDYSTTAIMSNDGSNWVNDGYSFTTPSSGTGVMDVRSRYINGKTISIAKVTLNVANSIQPGSFEEVPTPINVKVGEKKTIPNVGVSPKITFNTCTNISTISVMGNNIYVTGKNAGTCDFRASVNGGVKTYGYTVKVNNGSSNNDLSNKVEEMDVKLALHESKTVNVGAGSVFDKETCHYNELIKDESKLSTEGKVTLTNDGLGRSCYRQYRKTDGSYVKLNISATSSSSNNKPSTGTNPGTTPSPGTTTSPGTTPSPGIVNGTKIWPVKELTIYADAARTVSTGKSVTQGTQLIVTDLQAGAANESFKINWGGTEGWIERKWVMVDMITFDPRLEYPMPNASTPLYKIPDKDNVYRTLTTEPLYNSKVSALMYDTALKLSFAQDIASKEGYTLVVYDAYRPYHVSRKLRELAEKIVGSGNGNTGPLDNLLAKNYSSHNYGAAVDISLKKDGKELEMPTQMHILDTTAGTETPNTQILAQIMTEAGFKPLRSRYGGKLLEWWHFENKESINHKNNGGTACDFNFSNNSEASYTINNSSSPGTGSNLRSDGLCSSYTINYHPSYNRGGLNTVASYNARYWTTTFGYKHNLLLYQGEDNCNGNVYTAICYDPTSGAPEGNTYEPVAYVNPFDDIDAFAATASLVNSKQIEAFTLSIIQKYYDEIQTTAKGKVAAQIALRTYIYGNGLGSDHPTEGKEMNYRDLFCTWIEEESYGNCNDPLVKKWEPIAFYFEGGDAAGLLALAKEYWLYGNQAVEACNNGACEESDVLKEVGYEVLFNPINNICEAAADGVKKTYTISGTITGLNDYNSNPSASITLDSFACPTGFDCKIFVDDQQITSGTENNLKGFNKESVELKIEVTGDICNLSETADLFSITIKSYHPWDWHNVITVKPLDPNLQRMLLILENEYKATYKPDTSNMKVKCCGSNGCDSPELNPYDREHFDENLFKHSECCTNTEKMTDNQKEFVNAPEQGGPNNYCASDSACGDVEWNVYCGPQDIKANGENTERTLTYHINEAYDNEVGVKNFKKCVMEQGQDRAGNTYIENTVKYGQTEFCTVYCTEDWEMELPGYLDNVYAGTGFNLAIKRVEGKRTCFTNEIKINNFITKLNEKNRIVIEKANAYLKAKAAQTAYESVELQPIRIGCDYNYCDTVLDQDGNCPDGHYHNGQTSGNYNIKTNVPNLSYNYYTYDSNISLNGSGGNIGTGTNTISGGKFGNGWFSTDGRCNFSSEDPEAKFLEKNGLSEYTSLGEAVSQTKAAYNAAVSDRTDLINKFNTCYNWSNNFNLDEVNITYTYADSEMMNKITEGNNKFEVDGEVETTDDTKEMYCKNGANPQFTGCHSGTGTETATMLELSTPGDLTDTELKGTKSKISLDKYVQKVVGKKAAYNIKGSFFVENTTGYISYDGNDAPTRDELNRQQYVGKYWSSYYHTDDKVVPVSTSLPQGVYEYQLRFDGIGMYNGKDRDANPKKTGRLIGGTDGKGLKSVLKSYNLSNETATTETCYFEIGESNSLCHCCGKDVEVQVVSLETCEYGNCMDPPGEYLTDKADLAYYARAITLNDLNPNRRDLGSNWGGTREGILYENEAQSIQKGQATKTEIETNGYNVYETPQYSYTMTPSGIVSVKNQVDNYSNNNLACNEDGINCLSSFLDSVEDLNGVKVNARDTEFHSYSVDGRTLSWK